MGKQGSRSVIGTSLTIIGYFWSGLSVITALVLVVCFYSASWIIGGQICSTLTGLESIKNVKIVNCSQASFGIFRRCGYPSLNEDKELFIAPYCGRYSALEALPSIWWRITIILLAVVCVVSLVCALVAFASCFTRDVICRQSARAIGILQFICGFLNFCVAIFYPLGWGAWDVKQACGLNSRPYYLASCEIGWAYWASLTGAGALIISAALSWKSGLPDFEWKMLEVEDKQSAPSNTLHNPPTILTGDYFHPCNGSPKNVSPTITYSKSYDQFSR